MKLSAAWLGRRRGRQDRNWSGQTALTKPDLAGTSPGAPEACHIHWRWGTIHGAEFGGGNPIIPAGSNQTVEVALTRRNDGEDDPFDFRDLINREATDFAPLVFWYVPTGFRPSDSFHGHGGFFEAAS